MTPEQLLMSQAVFHPPNRPKPNNTGKVILVALGSFGLSVVISLLSDSIGAFLPAWGIMFVLGYGMFVEGEK